MKVLNHPHGSEENRYSLRKYSDILPWLFGPISERHANKTQVEGIVLRCVL